MASLSNQRNQTLPKSRRLRPRTTGALRKSHHHSQCDTFRTGQSPTLRSQAPQRFAKALLAMLDLSKRQAVGDRDPIRHWHKDRVVLLGDAAHPTLQSLAQGACMAIEDGLCLADCIASNSDHEAAFQHYENARAVRTARVTLESRYIGTSTIRTASRAKSIGKCSANAAKRILSGVSLGFMMDLHSQRPNLARSGSTGTCHAGAAIPARLPFRASTCPIA